MVISSSAYLKFEDSPALEHLKSRLTDEADLAAALQRLYCLVGGFVCLQGIAEAVC